MNTSPKDQVLVPECQDCAKANVKRNICNVIEHPAVWHKRGLCTARTEDPDWFAKANLAVANYRSGNSDSGNGIVKVKE